MHWASQRRAQIILVPFRAMIRVEGTYFDSSSVTLRGWDFQCWPTRLSKLSASCSLLEQLEHSPFGVSSAPYSQQAVVPLQWRKSNSRVRVSIATRTHSSVSRKGKSSIIPRMLFAGTLISLEAVDSSWYMKKQNEKKSSTGACVDNRLEYINEPGS